jgi:hypothetical protein
VVVDAVYDANAGGWFLSASGPGWAILGTIVCRGDPFSDAPGFCKGLGFMGHWNCVVDGIVQAVVFDCISNNQTTLVAQCNPFHAVFSLGGFMLDATAPAGGVGGGGGGGGITDTALGSWSLCNTTISGTLVSSSITVQAGATLVAILAASRGGAGNPTFNGVPMTARELESLGDGRLYVSIWTLLVNTTTTGVISTHPGTVNAALYMQAVEVQGRTFATFTVGQASGFASQPTMPGIVLPASPAYTQAAFFLHTGGAYAWSGALPFTSGGQDLSGCSGAAGGDDAGNGAYVLTEGFDITTASGTTAATLVGTTPAAWTGVYVTMT